MGVILTGEEQMAPKPEERDIPEGTEETKTYGPGVIQHKININKSKNKK